MLTLRQAMRGTDDWWPDVPELPSLPGSAGSDWWPDVPSIPGTDRTGGAGGSSGGGGATGSYGYGPTPEECAAAGADYDSATGQCVARGGTTPGGSTFEPPESPPKFNEKNLPPWVKKGIERCDAEGKIYDAATDECVEPDCPDGTTWSDDSYSCEPDAPPEPEPPGPPGPPGPKPGPRPAPPEPDRQKDPDHSTRVVVGAVIGAVAGAASGAVMASSRRSPAAGPGALGAAVGAALGAGVAWLTRGGA